MGKTIGIDLGTTNSAVAVLTGGEPEVLPERRGWTHDPVGRRLREVRRAAGGHRGQAPGGHQPREHDLQRQALHGPQVRRGGRGDEDRPLRGRPRPERRRAHQGGRQGVQPAGDQRDDPPEAEGGRRGLPRRDGDRRRHHRAGVLQRRPAPGDQGRRQDRRPRGQAHHQRAHRGRAGLRARQGDATRRSWSSTSAAARSTCRCSRSATASSRSSPPPATTTSAATTSTRRSSTGWSRSSSATTGIDLSQDHMALQRLYEAAEKAKIELSTTTSSADQPAVHHGRPDRPEAPRPAAHAGRSSRSWPTTCSSGSSGPPSRPSPTRA